MIFSTGTLRYSPKLLGESSSKWWAVLDCDETIIKYYCHLYHIHLHRCHTLQRPAWSSHITVIRDEEPADQFKPLWEKYAGERVEFAYSPEIHTNGEYLWLDVKCGRLLDIRAELGLPRKPMFDLHLSIGHIDEYV